MEASPTSLEECCIQFISKNIHSVCTKQYGREERCGSFANQDVFLDTHLSEKLLWAMSRQAMLNDETIHVFHPSVTRLRKFKIRESGSFLSAGSLSVLKQHNISELEVVGYDALTIQDFIQNLNETSRKNMRSFSINEKYLLDNFQGIAQLKNLKTLNLGVTNLDDTGFERIMTELDCLENLDISCTLVTNILPLFKKKDKLKYLGLYGIPITKTIRCLKSLKHLDISVDEQLFDLDADELMVAIAELPNLTSLDLSERDMRSAECAIRNFITEKSDLQFLGLLGTGFDHVLKEENFTRKSELKTTGISTDAQLLESLRRYPRREYYTEKSLLVLFDETKNIQEPRLDILKLVVGAMKNHRSAEHIQTNGTACLYNLTKTHVCSFHPCWLQEVVEVTLQAMEYHPTDTKQLQTNALLILCCDHILDDLTFDQFRCIQLTMEALCSHHDDNMECMALGICSSLARQISTKDNFKIASNSEYMGRLLSIIRKKTEMQDIGDTLENALLLLWNLTDESPKTCGICLATDGMKLFLDLFKVLETSEEDPRIENQTSILGIMSNIAEVKNLRKWLMTSEVLQVIIELLGSDTIDISYLAAATLSWLVSDADLDWVTSPVHFDKLVEQLSNRVKNWEPGVYTEVNYRTFRPLYELIKATKCPAVHQYTVWAIQHLCLTEEKKYCSMLREEGGYQIIKNLLIDSEEDEFVRKMCKNILDLCKSNISGNVTKPHGICKNCEHSKETTVDEDHQI